MAVLRVLRWAARKAEKMVVWWVDHWGAWKAGY
jgi:hypothetical protein